MRVIPIFCCVLMPLLPVAGQRVDEHISSDDARQIIAVVAADTKERIGSIDCLPANGPGPGTYAVECIDGSSMQRKPCYMRTDLVFVMVASSEEKQLPMGYTVQKLSDGWKIIKKKRMVD